MLQINMRFNLVVHLPLRSTCPCGGYGKHTLSFRPNSTLVFEDFVVRRIVGSFEIFRKKIIAECSPKSGRLPRSLVRRAR
jgi:hypothetical protein